MLAKVLLAKPHGNRPVSLIGWSLGARVVFAALEALEEHESGTRLLDGFTYTDSCLGLIENVYLIGAAATNNPKRWEKYVAVRERHKERERERETHID